MIRPHVAVFDRDGVLNVSSSDASSPFYYITDLGYLILKPGVKEALAIVRAHGIPTVLATKQRCISKGLVSSETVKLINVRLERTLDHHFDHILIEPINETKADIFKRIAQLYPVNPNHIHLFDDSEQERDIGARLGFTVWDGSLLYESVCRAFDVK